jgi:hypothetical protein
VATPAVPHKRLVFESGCLLTLTAFLLAYGWLRFSRDEETTYLLLLIVPGSTTIVYFIVGVLVPNLIASERIRWPLTITLPIVYGALMQLCAAFWLRGPNPIVKQELFSRAGQFWQRVQPAAALLISQIVVFSVWAVIAGRRKASE